MNKVYVDKARLLRRVIVISWISLALCFVIKIFGGNFFEIMCENPNYKALCEYADSHFWCKYLICFASSMVCEYFFLLSILQEYKFTKKQLFLVVLSIMASVFVKLYFDNFYIISDIWITFILPIILVGGNYKKYIEVVIAIVLSFAFQFISLIVKNLAITIIDESTFISLIYMLDVYIMFLLYYLYRNYNKEKK